MTVVKKQTELRVRGSARGEVCKRRVKSLNKTKDFRDWYRKTKSVRGPPKRSEKSNVRLTAEVLRDCDKGVMDRQEQRGFSVVIQHTLPIFLSPFFREHHVQKQLDRHNRIEQKSLRGRSTFHLLLETQSRTSPISGRTLDSETCVHHPYICKLSVKVFVKKRKN